MIYFWSDTHFNHEGIIGLCKRPDETFEDMNERLIGRWNMMVGHTDTIYFLGDFGFRRATGEPLAEIFARLAGHKHLVKGNHDEQNKEVLKLPWESISDIATVRYHGAKAIACHYPMESWKGMAKGYFHVHGHSHGNMRRMNRRFDVGVDVMLSPVSFDHLSMVASLQPFEASDHHGGIDL